MQFTEEKISEHEAVIEFPERDTPERAFIIIDAAEFMATELPEPDMILAPILQSQNIIMIYAPRGLGKTHLALAIALAIASGSKVLRWEALKARGVLFIDGEMPAHLLQERIELAVTAGDYDPTAPLRILTPDLQPNSAPNILDPEDQARICAVLEDIEVVILDNLSTLCRGGRENNADDWQEVQDFLLRLRQMHKTVVLIHHSGKSGQQRGTSRREDVLDTVIALRRPADYSQQDGARFEVHFEKARGFYGDDAEPFLAHLETDAKGNPIWTVLDMAKNRAQQVARLINEGWTQNEIAAELGINKSNVTRAKQKAIQEGLIND